MTPKPPHSPLRRTPWRTSSRTEALNQKNFLKWIDIDRIGQALFRTYPQTAPDTLSMKDLVQLITSLRFFGDTIHPPNGLYVDLIKEAWQDAATSAVPSPNAAAE